MTYNEYAQLLEAVNPETGELYQPEDFNVIRLERGRHGAMLQDAIWADTERLESDEEYADTTVEVHPGRDPRLDRRSATTRRRRPTRSRSPGSTLGTSHQLWMANEINKLIWPSPSGIGHIDEDRLERDRRDGAAPPRTGRRAGHHRPSRPTTASRTSTSTQALEALKADGVDVTGEGYARRGHPDRGRNSQRAAE